MDADDSKLHEIFSAELSKLELRAWDLLAKRGVDKTENRNSAFDQYVNSVGDDSVDTLPLFLLFVIFKCKEHLRNHKSTVMLPALITLAEFLVHMEIELGILTPNIERKLGKKIRSINATRAAIAAHKEDYEIASEIKEWFRQHRHEHRTAPASIDAFRAAKINTASYRTVQKYISEARKEDALHAERTPSK
ncbi:MAG: hypothetical protein CRU78_05895 [Candidatus Accumulibacter phosphatis]|uniref:Uncharacterized protein n=1 Tax=Candidatus Accumulibacter phosphatis TaxID=327160 RepID=A0A6A7RRM9_9PROT|nr:hypothetical protein [Candidatus Accumulibacter phosphatis]